jgi:hypothetical protein
MLKVGFQITLIIVLMVIVMVAAHFALVMMGVE